MLNYCVNCGSSLFSPNASICINCEKDPRILESELGDLYPYWLYDKLAVPKACITCGQDLVGNDVPMFQVSFSAEINPVPKRNLAGLILGFLTIHTAFFTGRMIDEVSEIRDKIETDLLQCGDCYHIYPAHIVMQDLENKRLMIMACRPFIDIVQGDEEIDLSFQLPISSAEVENGFSRTFEYEISFPGKTPVEISEATLDLPAGWAETFAREPMIRLRGKGAFNLDRTMRGDLYVYLEEGI